MFGFKIKTFFIYIYKVLAKISTHLLDIRKIPKVNSN